MPNTTRNMFEMELGFLCFLSLFLLSTSRSFASDFMDDSFYDYEAAKIQPLLARSNFIFTSQY